LCSRNRRRRNGRTVVDGIASFSTPPQITTQARFEIEFTSIGSLSIAHSRYLLRRWLYAERAQPLRLASGLSAVRTWTRSAGCQPTTAVWDNRRYALHPPRVCVLRRKSSAAGRYLHCTCQTADGVGHSPSDCAAERSGARQQWWGLARTGECGGLDRSADTSAGLRQPEPCIRVYSSSREAEQPAAFALFWPACAAPLDELALRRLEIKTLTRRASARGVSGGAADARRDHSPSDRMSAAPPRCAAPHVSRPE